jgi:hypothetical protein
LCGAGVEAHDVKARLDSAHAAHEGASGVLPQPVVVSRHDRGPVADGREDPFERRELGAASAVRHVARDEHRVHVRVEERVLEPLRGGLRRAVAAEVQVRDVRDRPVHGGKNTTRA